MVWIFGLLALGAPSARADEVATEVRFLRGLIEDFDLPHVAERALRRAEARFPDRRAEFTEVRARILLRRGRAEEAQALIQDLPPGSPLAADLKIAVGDRLFSTGEFEAALVQFREALTLLGPDAARDEARRESYLGASFRIAQVQRMEGDLAEAASTLESLVEATRGTNIERGVLGELIEVYVELARRASARERAGYVRKAEGLSFRLQAVRDVWFGRGVVAFAQLQALDGNLDRAARLIRDQWGALTTIDERLREQPAARSISPIPAARMILGQAHEARGRELAGRTDQVAEARQAMERAASQFYTVYLDFPDSAQATEARASARRVEAFYERQFGRRLSPSPDPRRPPPRDVYREADLLFVRRRWEQAAERYLELLATVGENPETPIAIARLGIALDRLGQSWVAQALEAHLAERYAGTEAGGQGLLEMARHYLERGDEDRMTRTYRLYLEAFPRHSLAAQVSFSLAAALLQDNRPDEARELFRVVADRYPDSEFGLRAVREVGLLDFREGDYTEAALRLKEFVDQSPAGLERASAQFYLAESRLLQREFREAIEAYGQVRTWLTDEAARYVAGEEEAPRARELLALTLLKTGQAYARMTDPPREVPAFRARAIELFEQVVEDFRDVPAAPRALAAQGAVLLDMGEPDRGFAVFDRLARDFPESPEGRTSRFALVRTALDLGLMDRAREAFESMLRDEAAFTTEDLILIGQAFTQADMFEEASRAYQTASRRLNPDEFTGDPEAWSDGTRTRAGLYQVLQVRLGESLVRQEKHEEAIQALRGMLERFPRSGLVFEARFLLATALRDSGEFADARRELGEIQRLIQGTGGRQAEALRARIEMALLHAAQGRLREALGEIVIIAVSANPRDEQTRPLVRRALLQGIEIGMNIPNYREVEDLATQFLEQFGNDPEARRIGEVRTEARLRAAGGG